MARTMALEWEQMLQWVHELEPGLAQPRAQKKRGLVLKWAQQRVTKQVIEWELAQELEPVPLPELELVRTKVLE